MFPRRLNMPKKQSFFLFGPRQTGKSTLLGQLLGDGDLLMNLLPESEYLGFVREPGRFRREVLAHLDRHPGATIAVDEVQRLPQLLLGRAVRRLLDSCDEDRGRKFGKGRRATVRSL